MSRTTSGLLAAFQVIINGRFWVITEGYVPVFGQLIRLDFHQLESSLVGCSATYPAPPLIGLVVTDPRFEP